MPSSSNRSSRRSRAPPTQFIDHAFKEIKILKKENKQLRKELQSLQGLQTNSGATAPEWVNSPQSLMTAAGDILYASGANTLAKLAKGSNDEVLTLASGVPSWAAAAGGGLSWQSVVTGSTLTAVAGNAYPINTTSNELSLKVS